MSIVIDFLAAWGVLCFLAFAAGAAMVIAAGARQRRQADAALDREIEDLYREQQP